MENFKLEPLSENFSIFVSKEHSFGTDAFLLSHFASPKKSDFACDLGTGCGIIPLLWFKNATFPKNVVAVDIQEKAITVLSETLKKTDIPITPLLCDLKKLPSDYNGRFSLVTCNPPYYKSGAGVISREVSDKIARHETECDFSDIVKVAARLLKFGGRFAVCFKPERLCDLITLMRENSVEPKRVQFVQKDEFSAPWLVLVEGKKGAKPFLEVLPPIFVYKDGEYTDFMKKIYWG